MLNFRKYSSFTVFSIIQKQSVGYKVEVITREQRFVCVFHLVITSLISIHPSIFCAWLIPLLWVAGLDPIPAAPLPNCNTPNISESTINVLVDICFLHIQAYFLHLFFSAEHQNFPFRSLLLHPKFTVNEFLLPQNPEGKPVVRIKSDI